MTLLILLGIIVVIVFAAVAIYNKLVRLRNTAKSSWSDIDVQCKKRYDLVPNLVETVKGYASHERTVFEKVTQATDCDKDLVTHTMRDFIDRGYIKTRQTDSTVTWYWTHNKQKDVGPFSYSA